MRVADSRRGLYNHRQRTAPCSAGSASSGLPRAHPRRRGHRGSAHDVHVTANDLVRQVGGAHGGRCDQVGDAHGPSRAEPEGAVEEIAVDRAASGRPGRHGGQHEQAYAPETLPSAPAGVESPLVPDDVEQYARPSRGSVGAKVDGGRRPIRTYRPAPSMGPGVPENHRWWFSSPWPEPRGASGLTAGAGGVRTVLERAGRVWRASRATRISTRSRGRGRSRRGRRGRRRR